MDWIARVAPGCSVRRDETTETTGSMDSSYPRPLTNHAARIGGRTLAKCPMTVNANPCIPLNLRHDPDGSAGIGDGPTSSLALALERLQALRGPHDRQDQIGIVEAQAASSLWRVRCARRRSPLSAERRNPPEAAALARCSRCGSRKLQQHYTCRDHDRDASGPATNPRAAGIGANRTYAKIIDSLWWGQSCDFELQLSPA
jgi:hypothetical protein